MFSPVIFKLDTVNIDNLDNFGDLILSDTPNLGKSSLGYHYYYHLTKSYLNITNNLESNNNFYYIVNPFEYNILNYEDSVKNTIKQYLNLKSDIPEINSQDFYKMWEMLFQFNIFNDKTLSCAIISENTNVLNYAINVFRTKFNISSTKDKYYDIELSKNKDKIKSTCNLIIADSGPDLGHNDLHQEQNAYTLILDEIIMALNNQELKGNFILKIFDSFTTLTIKFVYILSSFYDEVYVYKPYFSRQSDSEKYIICKGFKNNNNNIKSLEKIRSKIKEYIFDIYPELIIPREYINKFIFINIKICNTQQIIINEMTSYIKENNYFGEKYHKFKEEQINATKSWILTYLPPSNNLFEKSKEDITKILGQTMKLHSLEQERFMINLIN